MNKKTKYILRIVAYLPYQLLLAIVYSPFLVVAIAYANAEHLAFDYTYFTADNPMVNQEGPTMKRMKKHCWLIRFLFPWL
jgi:hypothetical protein